MSAIVGLAMIFAAILLVRAAKIGVPLQPTPWWVSDTMSAFIVAPVIVTLFAGGLGAIISWLAEGGWRATNPIIIGAGLAAVIAAYVVLSRLVRAWGQRVRPAPADLAQLAPAAADNDPRRPPGTPPMKRAA